MSERINKDTKHDNKKRREREDKARRSIKKRVDRESEGYSENMWELIVQFLNYLLPVCSNIGVSPEGRRKRLSFRAGFNTFIERRRIQKLD